MKKVLIFALAVLPVLFACKKTTNTSDMETPKFAEKAAKLELKNAIPVTTKDNKTVALQEINFMRSGRYVAEGVITKAETVTLSGTWTYDNGKGYVMTGDVTGSVTVTGSGSSSEVTVTTSSGAQTSQANVEGSKVTPGSTEDKIFRSWKISKIVLKEFEKLGSASITATSITSMVTELEKKIEIPSDAKAKLLAHEVTEISFDEGVMLIKFKDGSSFKGEMDKLSGSATSFSYDLSAFIENTDPVKGSIEFSGDNAIITLDVPNIKSMGTGKVVLTLAQVQ